MSTENTELVADLQDARSEIARLRAELEREWRSNHHTHCEFHDHDPNFPCRWPRRWPRPGIPSAPRSCTCVFSLLGTLMLRDVECSQYHYPGEYPIPGEWSS